MSGELLDWALRYAARGWRVFPLHGFVNGKCSCVRAGTEICSAKPSSPGKHPRVKGGFRAATTDKEQIRRWWGKWPDANIGIATGSGLAVIDIDGESGLAEFQALVAQHGRVPDTLVAQTGNGYHLVFSTRDGGPEVRNSARGNVHVRGEGGYIVAAPSRHYSGKNYQWVKAHNLAVLPDWLRQWSQGYEISGQTSSRGQLLAGGGDRNANLPGYLGRYNSRNVSTILDNSLNYIEYSPSEVERLRSALQSIPADNYETWFQVGMALQSLGWTTNEGDVGFELFDQWSATCPAKYSPAAAEAKWNSFGRSGRSGITVASIYHLAKQHGWKGAIAAQSLGAAAVGGGQDQQKPGPGSMNGTNGHHYALPPGLAVRPILWPDTTEEGKPRITLSNTLAAINHMGLNCRYDSFSYRYLVGGHALQLFSSEELSDSSIHVLRHAMIQDYRLDFKKENVRDAVLTACELRRFNPITDYLDSLTWDGTPRIGKWLSRYLGAKSTPYIDAIGRLVLLAAVRRARWPGTKFDHVLVLEGKEGTGKSQACKILAGNDYFSDATILHLDEKSQQEKIAGVWIYELSELTGIHRADHEALKQFFSRDTDSARPAYAHFNKKQPRRCIFIGTTNKKDYLVSETGNRRFWPVETGRIDLAALKHDRDQLWAEAAFEEAKGVSLMLPESLWEEAGQEQDKRMEADMWLDAIQNYLSSRDGDQLSASIKEVLEQNPFLRIPLNEATRAQEMRAGKILYRLGYRIRKRVRTKDGLEYRYFKGDAVERDVA